MISSGIKRGLATTAISALAVTGLPFLAGSAHADSINDLVGTRQVELFTQYSGVASTKFDGVNRSIHLLAGGGDDVVQVRFEYSVGGGAPVVISTVNRANGVFSDEWTPPTNVLGSRLTIRAVGISSVGTDIATAVDEQTNVLTNDSTDTVDIANAPGSILPVFQQPYGVEPEENGLAGSGVDHSTRQGIVTGTTSGTGAITLSDRVFDSPPRPPVTPSGGSFRGTVDMQDYDLSGTPDEAIIGAQQTNGSDDAEVVNLQSQAITNVTAVASPASIPDDGTARSTAVITVTDNQNRPLAGAQVIFDRNDNGLWDGASNGGTEASAYTDANGQVRFSGLTGLPGGGSRTYAFFVNTSAGDDYEPTIDFRRTVTVTSTSQTQTLLTTSSADGDAFDVDENDANDLRARVTDQNGNPIPGRTVYYSYAFRGFNGTTATTPNTALAPTDANGFTNVPFQNLGSGTYTLRTFLEQNGTPGVQADDLAGPDRVFKAGDSSLRFTEAPTATSESGTTDTYDASLTLGDGTPLPGRAVQFTYTRNAAGGNVVVASQANQPSGTTRASDTQATGTTNASGVARVALSDPASPDASELNGSLAATTVANAIGDANEDASPLRVNFIDFDDTTLTLGALPEGKPGEATTGSLRVLTDLDNNPATPAVPVEGLSVRLSVDQAAFFTNGTPPAGAAAGQDVRLENLGKAITVVTDANGNASYQTTIERDTGFDDDGQVSTTVTATSGSLSDTEGQVFDSSDPINGGTVSVDVSPASEQANAIAPTRTGDRIYYDVTTTDQFGNKVGGEPVELGTSGSVTNEVVAVDEFDDEVGGSTATSDFDDEGDLYVTAERPGSVTLTVSWTTGTTKFVANPGGEPTRAAGASETLRDTATERFYAIDFANSTYTLDSTEEDGVADVDTTVTETVTVIDQEGRPVQGISVEFIRSGPEEQDGDPNTFIVTDRNGKAAYNFTGTEPGTASITAVVAEQQGGEPVATLEDEIRFIGEPPPVDPDPVRISAQLGGQSNGAKADRLTVRTSPRGAASNALARLYTRINGRKVQVGQKRLNGQGAATFTTRDRNGRKFTSYWVQVNRTSDSTAARSNNKRVR